MTQQIVQVAGFSNSGKTTFVEKLVSRLIKENFQVGTVKHHGHGGELTSFDHGKDSWRHRQAGAVVSGAVSDGVLQLSVVKEVAWSPEELIELYKKFPIDVIVIEGFKASSFSKIVLVKEEEDLKLLSKLKNIFCVISWISIPLDLKSKEISYFQIDEEAKYINFIIQKLKGHDYE